MKLAVLIGMSSLLGKDVPTKLTQLASKVGLDLDSEVDEVFQHPLVKAFIDTEEGSITNDAEVVKDELDI